MYVEQIYIDCIAVGTYYIESNGVAAIIDPLRDPEPYIEMANQRGAKIKYVFITHFHADFVSGHIDLANKTGSSIVFGPTAAPSYNVYVGKDGEVFPIGGVNITLLHTPGHTMESSSYVLRDQKDIPYCVFTGDTLFLGDVGRPDLAVKSHLSQSDLAGILFDSLRNKIMPLPDEILVYPSHGAGSSCGKHMSKETVDTLGNQKKINYALRPNMTKAEFMEEILFGLAPPPAYFSKNAMMNRMGTEMTFEMVLSKGMQGVSVSQLDSLMADVDQRYLILDTRSHLEFQQGYIPGSINIGLDGNFAMWVGEMIEDIKQPIILVTQEGRAREAVMRLSRVGYDNCQGHLIGGFSDWVSEGYPVEKIYSIDPTQINDVKNTESSLHILDVRKQGEWDSCHLENAQHLPLSTVYENIDRLDKDQKMYVHCAAGYRSVMAISILKRNGFTNDKLVNINGGFNQMKHVDMGIPLSKKI